MGAGTRSLIPPSGAFSQFNQAPNANARGLFMTLSPYRRPTLEQCLLMPRLAVFTPITPGRFLKRTRAASTMPSYATCWDIAELATSNIFMAKDGIVFTPPNGTFLAGINRQ